MEFKTAQKRGIQRGVGWVYDDLKWLTDKEAKLANRQRDILLEPLSNEVNYSFRKNKIHIGKLSPGCVICGEGYWSCIYINTLCTKHCFFCPQYKKAKKEYPPREGGFTVNSPKDYVAYLKRFGFKGVGFSGGECLLVFKRLLSYIRAIRERLGEKIYIWIYTNGDLVNKDILRKLKEVGIDEIRFNICARNYDLQPVELAKDFINAVTVEIPAIPEDYELVKESLPKMQKIGVDYLNLHQLYITQFNYRNLIERNYTILHYPDFAIFES